MSKLKLTLTAEQVSSVASRHKRFMLDTSIPDGLQDHLNLNPVTLEFDVPNHALLEQVADKLKDKELFPKSVAKGKEYFTANPLTLEFDVPSPWRTDIENAPRDGRKIFIIDSSNDTFLVYPDYYTHDTWGTSAFDHEIFQNSDITYWMPIPELPKL